VEGVVAPAAVGSMPESCTIWGPTCDSLDKFPGEHNHLPELHVGDWLKFTNMGAYAISLTSDFNDMPRAQYHYLIDDEHWQLVQEVAKAAGNEEEEIWEAGGEGGAEIGTEIEVEGKEENMKVGECERFVLFRGAL
jgi:hypothetical protein